MEEMPRIKGFGACMISGKPYQPETSFFNQAMKRLEPFFPVESEVVSFGGFPIDRARKYLAKQVLNSRPDYVVIQFSSVDIVPPKGMRHAILKRLGLVQKKKGSSAKSSAAASAKSPAAKDHLDEFYGPMPPFGLLKKIKWLVRGFVGAVLLLPPCTSREVYCETMRSMVSEIKNSGAEPIVLMPFPLLDLWSDHLSSRFSAGIERLSREMNFQVVQTRELLRRHPRHKIFLGGGMHITEFAHSLIAEELSKVIVKASKPVVAQPSRPERASIQLSAFGYADNLSASLCCPPNNSPR